MTEYDSIYKMCKEHRHNAWWSAEELKELLPKLLAWLFDDNSLIGKSHFALDGERYEAFQDFYNSLDIYD